jgi:hypothetical protein
MQGLGATTADEIVDLPPFASWHAPAPARLQGLTHAPGRVWQSQEVRQLRTKPGCFDVEVPDSQI